MRWKFSVQASIDIRICSEEPHHIAIIYLEARLCPQGLKMSVLWTMFYGLMSAFAPVYGWILVLRALVGFGIGGAPQSWVTLVHPSNKQPCSWWSESGLTVKCPSFVRVTLYAEFLPMKSRATCILLIEVWSSHSSRCTALTCSDWLAGIYIII